MEKEILTAFDLDDKGETGTGSVDATEIRDEEKRLRRNSAIFTLAGLSALIGAGGLFALTNLPATGLGSLLAGLAIGGTAALGIGAFNLLRKAIGKPTLRFPKLQMLRKSMETGRVEPGLRPFAETNYLKKKLSKSDTDRVFFGVCGGLAEFASASPTLIRALFVLAFFFSMGTVTLAYFALALLMPILRRRRDS